MSKNNGKAAANAAKDSNLHEVRASQSCTSDSQQPSNFSNTLLIAKTSEIERKAINLTAQVGYQYDASLNQVLVDSQLLNKQVKPLPVGSAITCYFIKGEMANHDTLYRVLQIDEQLALNLLLNTTNISTCGTHHAVCNSRPWWNNRTRILFYRRIFKQESLPGKSENYLSLFNKIPPQPNATHIITSVSSGGEFLILLQASPEISIADVDEQLYKLCMVLRKNRKLADDDILTSYLNQLAIMAIYSNMNEQSLPLKMSSVYDQICHFNMEQSQPIFYQLRPVASIFSKLKVMYYDIDYEIVYSIQSELFSLYHLLDDAQQLINNYKNTDLHRVFKELQDRYYNMQQLLTILVSEIHQGKNSDDTLVEYFDQNVYRSLRNDVQKLINQTRQVIDLKDQPDFVAQDSLLPNTTKAVDLNILLLGETGVGKSTFINALVNYLQFDSLEQARKGEPVVLIPTSFLITRHEDFKETTVKFGASDPNEMHNLQGHSVTQKCKVYETSIKNHTNLKIIDTPGIGDTRGLEQDKANIEIIRSFVQKFTHLNAICILLKPNVERLHLSLRLCLVEIFQLLGTNVGNNILFCFTNTRATFYAPRDTAPLLDKMLKQIPGDHIPYELSNTFCFDSESFRYLAATKQGIEFHQRQELEYQESWTKSVIEAKRFLKYIKSLKMNSVINKDQPDWDYF